MIIDILKSDDEQKLENYLHQNPNVDEIIKPNESIKDDYLLNSPNLIDIAAYFGAVNCFIYLQNRDADMTHVDKMGLTIAHFASLGGSTEICDLLDSAGISFEGEDSSGSTAMHYACLSGNFSLVQKLYLRGFDIFAENKIGMRPIHYAAKSNSVELLDFLVSEGANINETNEGRNPLLLAALADRYENVNYLLEKGATIPHFVTTLTGKPELLLVVLARKGYYKTIKALIEKGKMDPNLQDKLGWTPLLHACDQGHIETCKTLVEHGADVNLASVFGFTPTHCAINRENDELKNYLISVGGKVQSKPITSEELQKYLN